MAGPSSPLFPDASCNGSPSALAGSSCAFASSYDSDLLSSRFILFFESAYPIFTWPAAVLCLHQAPPRRGMATLDSYLLAFLTFLLACHLRACLHRRQHWHPKLSPRTSRAAQAAALLQAPPQGSSELISSPPLRTCQSPPSPTSR